MLESRPMKNLAVLLLVSVPFLAPVSAAPPTQDAAVDNRTDARGDAPNAREEGARGDPFAGLRRATTGGMPPLRSVRLRLGTNADVTPRKVIVVNVLTTPAGAHVYRGRRLLGVTPLTLRSPQNSTPIDLIIRQKGFMTLRTRIERGTRRTYAFKLTPSKFR